MKQLSRRIFGICAVALFLLIGVASFVYSAEAAVLHGLLFANVALPSYSFSSVAKAAGIQVNTLRTWIKRKNIWFEPHELVEAESWGLPNRIFMRSAMRIAIMARLVAFGMSPSRAWRYTQGFSDFGEEQRDPGDLFPTGRTIFVAYPDEEFGYIANQPTGKAIDLALPVGIKTVKAMDYIAIDLNELSERLTKSLEAE